MDHLCPRFGATAPTKIFSFKQQLNAMNKIINRLATAAEKAILSRVNNNSLFAEYYNRSEKRAGWKRQATVYDKKEIKDWKMAVMVATDPDNPRRGQLMRFYQSLLLDLHLSSVIDTRILRVQRSSFKIVNEKGEENEELKTLLERPWYDELVKLVCGKTFQGTTLIELFDTDENGELLRINEIPQSNFIAQKGIIVKEEYDDNGVSYRDGFYKDYYLQIGGDWELGMLNQLAMIVLAKKLGLGSWMSYIEKFGVPPLFAITDRMDNSRRDELFEMLENFRMNHFAVLQGSESITVPNNYNVDAYQSFKSLINDVCNTEMSKRVLGGTAMVDEKSFVGSAQVQERVAQDRYEADKLLFKYYFNMHIRHKLAKLSNVYADFATHTFTWDNQETLNIEKYIDAVQKLSGSFDFDVDEIKARTGLPIIGTKVLATPQPVTEGQKKKPDGSVTNMPRYAPFAYSGISIQAATWDAAIERMADQLYSGQLKPQELDRDLVLKNYSALNKEAAAAWGDGYYEHPLTRKLRENLLNFSGAKSYNLMREIGALAKESNSKQQFVDQAKKTVHLHNETYLTVEKKFAANSSSSARNFEAFLADADIYPNLKNRTMGDSSVRDVHAANEGVVKPLNEWKIIPPYDPGCRCWLEQTIDPPTEKGLSNTDKHWANNPILSGQIFVDEHSYFTGIPKNINSVVVGNVNAMKVLTPYNRSIEVGDNKIFISDFYDPADLEANIQAAKITAEKVKKNIYIRPHVNSQGVKNPELGIGNKDDLADLKTFNSQSNTIEKFIKNGVKSANAQACKWIIFDMNGAPVVDFWSKVANKLRGELSNKKGYNKGIKQVVIINGDKSALFTREQINSKKYLEYFSDKAFK
ncbi:DUF935 family protein [candidate division KSB1 bacterium]|nr:MAG: DUF935 family protein [candidate division KSB1 bacterium]